MKIDSNKDKLDCFTKVSSSPSLAKMINSLGFRKVASGINSFCQTTEQLYFGQFKVYEIKHQIPGEDIFQFCISSILGANKMKDDLSNEIKSLFPNYAG